MAQPIHLEEIELAAPSHNPDLVATSFTFAEASHCDPCSSGGKVVMTNWFATTATCASGTFLAAHTAEVPVSSGQTHPGCQTVTQASPAVASAPATTVRTSVGSSLPSTPLRRSRRRERAVSLHAVERPHRDAASHELQLNHP